MRNVTTYRICAATGVAIVALGCLRNEISTVVVGGVLALYCLRWARIEREREEARRAYEEAVAAMRTEFETFAAQLGEALRPSVDAAIVAFRNVGEALSHVRVIRPDDGGDPVPPPE